MRLPLVTQIQSDRLPAVMRGAGLRLLWVCLAVWGLGMLSPRVTPHQAAVIVFVGAGVVIGLALLLAAGTRRILRSLRIGLVDRTVAGAEALLVLVRRIGLLVLALGFFLFWTLVYLGVWWWHPASAFTGLGPHPYFSDFFYYAVSTAFISPPGDILAHTRGARTATMIEIVTGAALLSVYLASFVDLRPPTLAKEPDTETSQAPT